MIKTATFFDIERNSFVDGPGIRTTVFFKGCNLRCKWCHNPESQNFKKEILFYQNKCTGCGRCADLSVDNEKFFCLNDAKEICGREYTVQEYFSEYFPAKKLKIIKPAVDYIHENYTKEHISVEALSEICGITPEYFRKIFKSFYGISPIKYINNLKITIAKELLESNMYSVTETAIMSGYTEMSHFSREFKKATGVSPSSYKDF